jgi:hypothetical protein
MKEQEKRKTAEDLGAEIWELIREREDKSPAIVLSALCKLLGMIIGRLAANEDLLDGGVTLAASAILAAAEQEYAKKKAST